MTQRLFLHVGAPKSGTTYLQSVLRHNRAALARQGVLVVGERHLDLVHAGLVVREDPRLAKLPAAAATAWQRCVADIRGWSGSVAVLSYELLAGASREQAQRALADLAGIEVHVVFTARDLGRALPSAWQERLKFAVSTPLEDWRPRREEDGPRAEWGWRTMDPAGVLGRWAATLSPAQVHLVMVPSRAAGAEELWHRFARACGLADLAVDLDLKVSNESLGAGPAELLRRLNEIIGPPLDTNREQARWLRDTLAHQVLVPLGGPRLAITEEQYAEALARSEQAIRTLQQAGYQVEGDLEGLRATRPDGVLPGSVSTEELLETSLHTILGLLLLLRERSGPTGNPGGRGVPEQRPVVDRLRGWLRRLC